MEHSTVTGYRLHGQGDDGSTISETCAECTVKVYGLNPGVGYIFSVCGSNRHGEGPRSYSSSKVTTLTYSRTGKNAQVSAARYSEIAGRPQLPQFADSSEGLERDVARDSRVKALSAKLSSTQKQLSDERTLVAKLRQEMALQKKGDQLEEEEALRTQLSSATEAKQRLQTEISKLSREAAAERVKAEQLHTEKDALDERLKKRIAGLEADLNNECLSKKQLQEQHSKSLQQIQELQLSAKDQEQSRERAQSQLKDHLDEQTGFEHQVETLTAELENERSAHERTQERVAELEQLLREAKDAKGEVEIELRAVNGHVLQLEGELEHLHSEAAGVSKLHSRIRELEDQNTELEAILSAHDTAPGPTSDINEELPMPFLKQLFDHVDDAEEPTGFAERKHLISALEALEPRNSRIMELVAVLQSSSQFLVDGDDFGKLAKDWLVGESEVRSEGDVPGEHTVKVNKPVTASVQLSAAKKKTQSQTVKASIQLKPRNKKPQLQTEHLTEAEKDQISAFFARLDLDGDGQLDLSEMHELYGEDKFHMKKFFAELDHDGDGRVSLQEMMAWFDSDRNQLSAEEFVAKLSEYDVIQDERSPTLDQQQ